jgi:hypothetical protein
MHRSALVLVTIPVLCALAASPSTGAPAAGTALTGETSAPLVDFDGDGQADLAVGAPGEDVGGIADAGAVTVLASGSGWRSFTQSSAADSGSAERADRFGSALAAGDFDGDGFTDLAVGAGTEDGGAVVDSGAVNVLYGSPRGVTADGGRVFTQNTAGVASSAERGDLFGVALAAADFDGDGLADLAIGVRGEDGAAVDAGAVAVLYGTSAGLTGSASQLFTQNNAGTGNRAETGDWFGSALAAGDFDADGVADLAVGVPREDVVATRDAGALNVLRGSAAGLTGVGGQLFTEDTSGVAGSAETGDAFGSALATGDLGSDGSADLAVGVPAEDVYAATDAGAVHVLHGSPAGLTGLGSRLYTQNSLGYTDHAEVGDLFGFSLVAVDFHDVGDSLAVGAPGEDVGAAVDAGTVHIDGQSLTENSPNMAGAPESGDRFGASLADVADRPALLVVGVPGEGGGTGAAMFVTGHLDDGDQLPSVGTLVDQNSPDLPGVSEPGDFWGGSLIGS